MNRKELQGGGDPVDVTSPGYDPAELAARIPRGGCPADQAPLTQIEDGYGGYDS